MSSTENNNVSARIYTKDYAQLLETVFNVRKAFSNAFAPVQMVDGIQHNKTAFTVKTNATPVVVGEYKTGANDVMGDGSGLNNRFGNITEVIYGDVDVPFDYNYAIHEGLDRHTVNNDLDSAVADRLKLQSEALVRKANQRNGKFFSDNAGKTLALTAIDKENVKKLFAEVSKYLTDNEINADVTAYVRPEVYNVITELTKTVNNSGFDTSISVESTPSKYFGENDLAYFIANGIAIHFIGIEVARTIEAVNFNGVLLQGASKGGTFTLDDNKKAIIKVTGTPNL